MRHRNPASGVPSRITERPSPVSDRRGSLERHRATQIVERRLLTSPRALLHHVQEGGSEAWPERLPRGDPGARCDGSQRSSARASASLERVQLPFAALSTTRGGCRARAWTVQSFHLLKKPDASAALPPPRRERLVVCGCPGGATGDGALGGAGSSRAGARRTHRAREPPRASHPLPRRFGRRARAGGRRNTPHREGRCAARGLSLIHI